MIRKILFLLLIPVFATAQNITIQGSWTVNIDSNHLLGDAGTDLDKYAFSEYTQILVDISGVSGVTYSVSAHIEKDNWPEHFNLFVRRTSNGSATDHGENLIYGGLDPIVLTEIPQYFFKGIGNRSGIYLRLAVYGLSVTNLPPSTSSVTVHYTITTGD